MQHHPTRIDVTPRYSVPSDDEGAYLLSSMRFVDSRAGWAVGSGQILRTIDGGRTWRHANAQRFLNETLSLYDVAPIDSHTCWLLVFHGARDLRCFVTRDAGHSWSEKYQVALPFSFSKIFFLDSQRGWIVRGAEAESEASLHFTEDSGRHWVDVPLALRGQPRRLFFSDRKNGWLLESYLREGARASRILRTEDGGRTWGVEVEFRGDAMAFHLLGEKSMLISGREGMLLRYETVTRSLRKITTNTNLNLEDVRFNASRGLAVGTADLISSRRSVLFLLSTDFGRTWRRLRSPIRDGLFAVYLKTWQTGVLAANKGLYEFRLT